MLALAEVKRIAARAETAKQFDAPDTWWETVISLLGLPVEEEAPELRHTPRMTWILAAGILIFGLLACTDLERATGALGLVPAMPWRLGGATFITSFFIHAGAFHLLGNLYFLVVFGDNVEDHLGKGRYLALIALSAVAGSLLHVAVAPHSQVPCVGASGGISGILAFYALRFPMARLVVAVSIRFRVLGWLRIRAWAAFAIWLVLQLLGSLGQARGAGGVSYVAHLGGVLAGLLSWIVWRKL
jgi:membrane associated rhomboid family serine protease